MKKHIRKVTEYIPIGMRTAKTALAVVVCLLIYYGGQQLGLVNSSDAFLACTSALICMRDSIDKSLKSGFHRLMGTFFGAAIGLLYLYIDGWFSNYFVQIVTISIGIMIIIFFCNVMDINEAIVIGCVVFLFIAMQQADIDPMEHCVRRFIDTSVGIGISILINHVIHNPDNVE